MAKVKVLIDRPLIFESLRKEGLTSNDIDIVFLTHHHLDHTLLTAIFKEAKVLDGETIYESDMEYELKGKIPGTSIKIIKTPGHGKIFRNPLRI